MRTFVSACYLTTFALGVVTAFQNDPATNTNSRPATKPSFPVIDLSENASEEDLVDRIAQACSEYGFFQVTSHGIDEDLVKAFQEQCELYFALPYETKLKWKRNEGNSRGYFDDELTKQRRDWKEALDFGVPGSRKWDVPDEDPSNLCLDGWNQLPSEDILPNFRNEGEVLGSILLQSTL